MCRFYWRPVKSTKQQVLLTGYVRFAAARVTGLRGRAPQIRNHEHQGAGVPASIPWSEGARALMFVTIARQNLQTCRPRHYSTYKEARQFGMA